MIQTACPEVAPGGTVTVRSTNEEEDGARVAVGRGLAADGGGGGAVAPAFALAM